MLPRIFEPFYSQPPHEGTPGLGIGLTISRQIATALKGEISVESEPGQGSRFTVRLPLERSEAANQPCLPSPVLRALVLDDEPDVLTLMQETLASFGFSVDAVRNGNMALEKATQNPYDLILLDVNVPGLTGIEVSRRIRAANRPGKILLFSALIRHDADAIIAEALADGFMPKPFNFETLERRMRQLGFAATL
jgi:CheY-like chemotaxis protein